MNTLANSSPTSGYSQHRAGPGAIMPPERVRTRYIDLMSFSSDTGFYYFVPQAVVPPVSEAVEVALFASPQQRGVPLVFRTGGTILSGQAIADGLLVDLSQFWAQLTVEQGGELG